MHSGTKYNPADFVDVFELLTIISKVLWWIEIVTEIFLNHFFNICHIIVTNKTEF